MSIRHRQWKTMSGQPRSAWIVDFVQDGARRIRSFHSAKQAWDWWRLKSRLLASGDGVDPDRVGVVPKRKLRPRPPQIDACIVCGCGLSEGRKAHHAITCSPACHADHKKQREHARWLRRRQDTEAMEKRREYSRWHSQRRLALWREFQQLERQLGEID
jgi:hypothetical protein